MRDIPYIWNSLRNSRSWFYLFLRIMVMTDENLLGERVMTVTWRKVREYTDIIYEHDEGGEGIARITINRPEVRNAFRPQTVHEMIDAFWHAHDDQNIGV